MEYLFSAFLVHAYFLIYVKKKRMYLEITAMSRLIYLSYSLASVKEAVWYQGTKVRLLFHFFTRWKFFMCHLLCVTSWEIKKIDPLKNNCDLHVALLTTAVWINTARRYQQEEALDVFPLLLNSFGRNVIFFFLCPVFCFICLAFFPLFCPNKYSLRSTCGGQDFQVLRNPALPVYFWIFGLVFFFQFILQKTLNRKLF